MLVFERHSRLPHPAAEVGAYLRRPSAFERLLPPWQDFRVVEHDAGMEDGARIVLQGARGGMRRRVTVDVGCEDDLLVLRFRGPRLDLKYTQRVLPYGEGESELVDRLEYGGHARSSVGLSRAWRPQRRLERMLRFRDTRTWIDLDRHRQWADEKRLRVLIAGAGGLIGRHLATYLTCAGHEVIRLVRRPAADRDEVEWDPMSSRFDASSLLGVDAVVNLAGATMASLWTKKRKDQLSGSRLRSTKTLVEAMGRLDTPPAVFISASAVGAYGSRGDEILTDRSDRGEGFLADLCAEWEEAAQEASVVGVRVVTPRFGLVLTAAGGVLHAMLPPFSAGIGGRIADGHQWWSWVALDDLVAALEWIMYDSRFGGAVNIVAPEPVRNRDFTEILGRVVSRPAKLRAPRPVLERLGGMPKEMLLASQRAVPSRLCEQGFKFAFPGLEKALRFELGR